MNAVSGDAAEKDAMTEQAETGPVRGRAFWRAVGAGLFGLGLLGIALPLLPTTIFWILAVLAVRRSDPELAERIRAWPTIGKTVSDFLDHGVIAPRGKTAALTAMAVSAGLLLWRLETGPILLVALAGLAAAAAYVASRPGRAPGGG